MARLIERAQCLGTACHIPFFIPPCSPTTFRFHFPTPHRGLCHVCKTVPTGRKGARGGQHPLWQGSRSSCSTRIWLAQPSTQPIPQSGFVAVEESTTRHAALHCPLMGGLESTIWPVAHKLARKRSRFLPPGMLFARWIQSKYKGVYCVGMPC